MFLETHFNHVLEALKGLKCIILLSAHDDIKLLSSVSSLSHPTVMTVNIYQ